MGDYEQILVERDGPVAVVTLNRPDRMNAWTWTMSRELGEAFNDMDADDDVRAIVVTGAGKAFCAGADLGSGGETFTGKSNDLGSADDAKAVRAARRPRRLNTPIIAAINGAAVGAGLTMPMEWDLRVAADDAKLGFVFNRRGVMPDADLIWIVQRYIGFAHAMDVLLTGRIFRGEEAAEMGLVNRAVPAGDVVDTALEMAHDIATNVAPVSAAITKRLMYEFLDSPDHRECARLQGELFAWTGRQPDAKEGVMSFVERRDPEWQMSKTADLPDRFRRSGEDGS